LCGTPAVHTRQARTPDGTRFEFRRLVDDEYRLFLAMATIAKLFD
jgi:hypothetical protein